MSDQNWFQRGEQGIQRAQQIAEEQAAGYVSRLWLKPKGRATVTFLDSDGFYFYEHQLKIGGDWKNWFTCRKDFSECPLCDADNRSGYVCAYTIIDHTKFTTRNGIEVANQKRLLVVKPAVMNKLARRKEQMEGDLTFTVMDFYRDSADECSTGEDIQIRKRLSRDELLKLKPANVSAEEWLQPYDYLKLFEPKSVDELRRLVGQTPPPGADGFDGASGGRGGSNFVPPSGASTTAEADINSLL